MQNIHDSWYDRQLKFINEISRLSFTGIDIVSSIRLLKIYFHYNKPDDIAKELARLQVLAQEMESIINSKVGG